MSFLRQKRRKCGETWRRADVKPEADIGAMRLQVKGSDYVPGPYTVYGMRPESRTVLWPSVQIRSCSRVEAENAVTTLGMPFPCKCQQHKSSRSCHAPKCPTRNCYTSHSGSIGYSKVTWSGPQPVGWEVDSPLKEATVKAGKEGRLASHLHTELEHLLARCTTRFLHGWPKAKTVGSIIQRTRQVDAEQPLQRGQHCPVP
ncbi:hypothetical protein AAY473_029213 [Plecturocebus cupreus]